MVKLRGFLGGGGGKEAVVPIVDIFECRYCIIWFNPVQFWILCDRNQSSLTREQERYYVVLQCCAFLSS